MLELISGKTGSGKSWYCLEKIKEKLLQEPMGKAILLLVPEHMTYRVERQLADMMADLGKGISRCYVFGFRRFAYQVMQETGGGLEPGLTELGRQLLLKKILQNRAQELTVFRRAAGKQGFTSEVGDIINELKGYNFTPEQLQELSQAVDEPQLQGKLQDIALLYGDFNQAVAGRYKDSKDVLHKLLEKLPESELVKGADIWLDGFLFFNPLERQIINALADFGADLHVTFTLEPEKIQAGEKALGIQREDIFFRGYGTRNYLLAMAEAKDMAVQEQLLTKNYRFLKPELAGIESQWQRFEPEAVAIANTENGYEPAVKIAEAATMRLEIEAMAADIVRLVREKGYKWSEIGILLRDEESYGSTTAMILQDYGIPYFSDQKRQCIHHPLAELLRSALAICTKRYGWAYDNVFRCLKTGFFGLTLEQLDLLENYVLEFGINTKSRWQQEDNWEFVARYSLDDGEEADEAQMLRASKADQLRRQVAEPLLALQKDMLAADSAAKRGKAVYDFLVQLNVPEQLQQWANQDEAAGRLEQVREHQQVWADIMALLDQLTEIGDEEEGGSKAENLRSFTELLEDGISNLSISIIPPGLDYVNIASFDQNSLANSRAIYILGANAGTMPRRSSENILLSDADRIRMNRAGAEAKLSCEAISVIGEENSYNEGYLLYKGFNLAKEYLWVSYVLADESGDGREKSQIVKRLQKMLPQVPLELYVLEKGPEQDDGHDEAMLANSRQALSALAGALHQCQETGQLSETWQAVYNYLLQQDKTDAGDADIKEILELVRKALSAKYGDDKLPREIAQALFASGKSLRGSVTKLERYNNCPFQFYAQYGLRLKDRKISSFSNPELGTLLHGVLKEFGEKLQAEGRHWSDVEPPEQKQMVHEIIGRLAPRLQNNILYSRQQLQVQLKRIERTAAFALARLCEFDKVSQLEPSYFEKSFGGSNTQKLNLVYQLTGGNRLELSGQIDRIDMSEDGRYFIIMDYKTGTAAINVVDVYYGLKLQLLTYTLVAMEMLAKERHQESLPIGMLYYFLKKPVKSLGSHAEGKGDIVKALEDELKMPGWIVADLELVQLLDKDIMAKTNSRFIKASLKKDGTLSKQSSSLRTERELEMILSYVGKLLEKTGNDILDGHIEPKPFKNKQSMTCNYCSYRALCGFDAQLAGFGYRSKDMKDEVCLAEIEASLAPEELEQIDNKLTERNKARAEAKEAEAKEKASKKQEVAE